MSSPAAAGLTHGAFYTHFESKEALCAEVIARASGRSGTALESTVNWRTSIEAYLSPNTCAITPMAARLLRWEATCRARARQSGPPFPTHSSSIDALAARLGHKGEAPGREDAIEALATMVGALVLARTAATSQLRDEILGAARNKLLEAPRT